jgi:ABC-2 type transport system ATP-binding protein
MSKDKDEIAIKVSGVSKSFKLPHEKNTSIKSFVTNPFKKRTFEKQEVLKDISFEIKKGEFFGIVGRNGSGKSTLLKLLAGIYSPDKGYIQINGKLTPFIELGVGFNPELTGRENVFLNGALLGFNRKEMNLMYDEIVEFAELEKFMDQKLKNYSSGMQVRLAFSIAIRAKTGILLLDEVLAVGDEAFQRKCYNYFSKLKREGRTVILVSHSMSVVRDYCTRSLLLNDGEVEYIGDVKNAVRKYTELNMTDIQQQSNAGPKLYGNGDATITSVTTKYKDKKQTLFRPKQEIEVQIDITANKALQNPVIGMIIQDDQGRVVFATNTIELNKKLASIKAAQSVSATFVIDNVYTNSTYNISCAITSTDRAIIYSRIEEASTFDVAGWSMEHSMVHPNHSFELTITN